MKLRDTICGYAVRPIGPEKIEALYALCRSNPSYYLHLEEPLSKEKLKADLTALPPGAEAKNKGYDGFWDGDRLVAALEWILAYPDRRTAVIGFFMVDRAFQHKGIGSDIIRQVLHDWKENGFDTVVLNYVSGNEQSHAFWLKNGFRDTGEEEVCGSVRFAVMERTL